MFVLKIGVAIVLMAVIIGGLSFLSAVLEQRLNDQHPIYTGRKKNYIDMRQTEDEVQRDR